jgi:hypothetical protein
VWKAKIEHRPVRKACVASKPVWKANCVHGSSYINHHSKKVLGWLAQFNGFQHWLTILTTFYTGQHG